MTVGLPGTGIGGLFYLALAVAMPFREVFRALRGRSSASRWRFIGVQLGMVAGIITTLWVQAWLIGVLARSLVRLRPDGFFAAEFQQIARDGAWVSGYAAATGLGVLVAILITVHVARFFVRREPYRLGQAPGVPRGTGRSVPPSPRPGIRREAFESPAL